MLFVGLGGESGDGQAIFKFGCESDERTTAASYSKVVRRSVQKADEDKDHSSLVKSRVKGSRWERNSRLIRQKTTRAHEW